MDRVLVEQWIREHGVEVFSRSSGPGGQHVNRTECRVQLTVETALIEGLSEAERARLPARVTVVVQDERSQRTNRDLAVERLLDKLARALHRDRPRRATKPTRASQERRLLAKRVAQRHRQNRQSFD